MAIETRPIPGHPGYFATSEGVIIGLRGRPLKSWRAGSNLAYDYVNLGRQEKGGVHRYVCMAFHGSPPTPKHEAAHVDGKSLNNTPDNLAWKTRAENEADKDAHGTANRHTFPSGEAHCKAKITRAIAKRIRRSKRGASVLAARYGISTSTVRRIIRGELWR